MKTVRYEHARIGESYTETVHDSGMRIYVCQKKMRSTYAMLGVPFGSLDTAFATAQGRVQLPPGVAHFLEHRMFGNADGRDATEDFAAYGADVNAFTAYDKTVYLFSTATEFAACLTKLIEFVTEPYFPSDAVDAERSIIAEEIRMSLDDPYEQGYIARLRSMYAGGAVREDICGSLASIAQIDSDMLYQTYRAFYHPQNLILAVSGDVTTEEVLEVVDRCLGKQTQTAAFPVFSSPTTEAPRMRDASLNMPVSKPIFNIGVRLPNAAQAYVPPAFADQRLLYRDTLLSVLAEALFSRAGTFYSELLEEELIRTGYSYGATVLRDLSYLSIMGEGARVGEIRRRFCAYLEQLRVEGVSEEEFERGRRVLYADFVTSFDSAEDIASVLFSAAVDGVPAFACADMIERIAREDANRLLREECTPERVQMTVVRPMRKRRAQKEK